MRILVRAEKQDGGIVLKRVLRAVPVMHVPVHDQHARETMTLLDIPGRDRHVIIQAKAHGAIGLGMVSGRTNRAEDLIDPIGHNGVDGRQGPAGGEMRGRQRTGRQGRVQIE